MKDPYRVLDLPPDADDGRVRQAYLIKIQEFPPEKDPERFKAVRLAYETLKTLRLRLAYALFNTEPVELEDILEHGLSSSTPGRPSEDLLRRTLAGGVGKSRFRETGADQGGGGNG